MRPKISLTEVQDFSKFVIDNHRQISPRVLCSEFCKIQKSFLDGTNTDEFCKEADNLVDNLIEKQNNELAGVVVSFLCKITEFIPNLLENFAAKGYALAKENDDVVHMTARLNELRKIYMGKPDKLYKYIQVLYKQEGCLEELTKNYEHAKMNYKTASREIAPKRRYEVMLAYVRTEIGKLTRKKHPHHALEKLLKAKQTFINSGNEKCVKYIELLLKEIQNSTEIASRKNFS